MLSPAARSYFSAGPDASLPRGNRCDALSTDDLSALLVAGAAIAAKKPDRAVSVLRSYVVRQEHRVNPRILERLAAAQFASKRPAHAERTLLRGLATHPGDERLRLALAEVLAIRSKRAAAISTWEKVPKPLRLEAPVWILVAMIRAYRMECRHRDAAELAREATALWPGNDQLELEIARNRPFVVDWSNSMHDLGISAQTDHGVAGVIDSLGFLDGAGGPLYGRILPGNSVAPEVTFFVNDLAVASTVAAESSSDSCMLTFSFNCTQLLEYLGDGDVFRIECSGFPVILPRLGMAAEVRCGHESRFDLLRRQIDEGYVFTKDGRLRPGHDAASKRLLLDFFEDVATLIAEQTGQPVYPFYGNLLGAIRENDFIKHDVDGFDMLYLCAGCEPASVTNEMENVCRLLLERGYVLKVKSTSVTIRRSPGDTAFLDLNYGWFTVDDIFNVSYGWRYSPVRGRSRFIARRFCRIADRSVAVPGNSEEVLVQLYGRQWRSLNQGFCTSSEIRRDDGFLLSRAMRNSLRSRPQSATG